MIRAGAAPTALACALLLAAHAAAEPLDLARAEGAVRIATFNASLSRRGAGMLVRDLAEGSDQVAAVVEIVLTVRPDILLLNELDHDPAGRAVTLFAGLLREGGLDYPYLHAGPMNTGIPTGHDLDGDGKAGGPADAFGYGRFPGQYGMALLSRHPIETAGLRSFRDLRWAEMPGALRPPGVEDAVWNDLRLSSKSHWDVPVRLPSGALLHLLASHPTPPVFDGPEDFNGRRNHDEIRFWLDYIEGAGWIEDDAGRPGGLPGGAAFVILGDLNADPFDGDSRDGIAARLLAHPMIRDPRPASPGAVAAAEAGEASAAHAGPHALDTAEWSERFAGNLRVDYVLPSAGLTVSGAGVFWPGPDDPQAPLVAAGRRPASSDHRLVWVDILPPDAR